MFELTPPRADYSWTTLPDYEPAPPVTMNPWYDESLQEQRDGSGCSVYLIESKSHYKIGISTEPNARLRELNTGNAEPLVLVAVRAGGIVLERHLHELLDSYRYRGEWFDKHLMVWKTFMEAQMPDESSERVFELAG